MIDAVSYKMGQKKGYTAGYSDGYAQGEDDGEQTVVIESGITCTDDGSGNITITEG